MQGICAGTRIGRRRVRAYLWRNAHAEEKIWACWSKEKNIAEDDVIKGCLEAAGFDPSLADTGLLSGAQAYEANLEDAVNAGVFGAPFFITDDGARFWGQDRLDQLDMHLGGQL